MNRQRILVGLLLLVAVTMLPYYFADRAASRMKKEMALLEEQLEIQRQKALVTRNTEQQVTVQEQTTVSIEKRMIGKDPFAVIQRELTAVAARAQVQMVELTLGGAEPTKETPSLVQYAATVEVAGSFEAFLEFVRLLEQHTLLISIPDLKVSPPVPGSTPAPGAKTGPAFRTRLSLTFYGRATTSN